MKSAVSHSVGVGTKNLVIIALFVAISFVGSHIRIFGTIAFDSLPAFLAAILLGPWYGAAIGFLGHIFTALTSGFPLSVPIHMVVATGMAITMLGFGYTYAALKNKASQTVNLLITGVVGVILNGPFSLALSMAALAFIAGSEVAMGLLVMLLPLIIASAANIVIAFAIFRPLKVIWNKTG